MSLREEIEPFWEGDGLIAPYPNPNHNFRSCDNGTMFVSEYYTMLFDNGLLVEQDKIDYEAKIRASMVQGCNGLVARAPGDHGDTDPDDYHAIFATCVVLGLKTLGSDILNWGLSHKGSFNPQSPETWTKESCLFRMLQLLCMAYCAAGKTPFYMWPLFGISAAIIATSCRNTPPGDTDARRLAWHLIRAVTPFSWTCRQAAKIWFDRLYKDYPNGMQGVAQIYYSPGPPEHPFRKYWSQKRLGAE